MTALIEKSVNRMLFTMKSGTTVRNLHRKNLNIFEYQSF